MERNEMMCFGVKVCKWWGTCGFNLQDIRAHGIIERERKKINSLRRTVRKEKREKFKLC
jgi:hypothetical protein